MRRVLIILMVSLVFGDYNYINYKDIVGRTPKTIKKSIRDKESRCEESFSDGLMKLKLNSNINKQNYLKIIAIEVMSYYFKRIKNIVAVYSYSKYKLGTFSGEYYFDYTREQWEEIKNDYKDGIDKLVELHNLLITLLDENELIYYKMLVDKMLLMIKLTENNVEGLNEVKLEVLSEFVEDSSYEKLFSLEVESKFSKVLLTSEQLNGNLIHNLRKLKKDHKKLLDTFDTFLGNYKAFVRNVYLTEYDSSIKNYDKNRSKLIKTVNVLDEIYIAIDDNFSKLCVVYDKLKSGDINGGQALVKLNNTTEELKSSYKKFITFKYKSFLRILLYNYMEYKEKLIVFIVDKAFNKYKNYKQIEENADTRFWFVTFYRDNLTILVEKITNIKNIYDEKCNKDEYL